LQRHEIRNSNTRLPTPETAFSLCAGISGNGGQVEIPGPDLDYMGTKIIWACRARAGRNNFQILKIQMTENSYLEF
jgi:hypothetical protein